MELWGQAEMVMPVDVLTLSLLVGALQLALRHPGFPAESRRVVVDFLDKAIRALEMFNPVFGRVGRMGNDPANDVLNTAWREVDRG